MAINILTHIGEGGYTFANLVADLPKEGDIELNVASPGGDVDEADLMYSHLVNEKKKGRKIYAYLLGEVASAASYLVMIADEVVAMPQARIMIHNAWGQSVGNAQQLRNAADRFDRIDRSIAAIYAAKTGKDEASLLAMMAAETWMTAAEAMEHGFVDRIETVNAQAITFGKAYAYLKPEEKPKPKIKNMFKTLRKAVALLYPEKAKAMYDELADGTVIFVESEDGDWTGKSVFVEDADGNMTPAPDGTHDLRDGRKIVVAGGVITEVVAAQASAQDEEINALKAENAQLKAQLGEIEPVMAALIEKVEALEKPAAPSVNARVRTTPAPVQNRKPNETEGVKLNPQFMEQRYGANWEKTLEFKSKIVNKK